MMRACRKLRGLAGMISTVKATMHKVVGAMADDLLPPRDLANAAFAVMVWASSKMSAEERDKLLNGFSIAIRDRVSSLPDGTIPPKGSSPSSPKSKQSMVRSNKKRRSASPFRDYRARSASGRL